jgi:hypothetical protein
MTAQKAQADVLLHRLHYALPGWDAAAERRDAQDEFHSAAQARSWADGDFDADHGLAFDGVGARPHRGGGGGCARALAVYTSSPKKEQNLKRRNAASKPEGCLREAFLLQRRPLPLSAAFRDGSFYVVCAFVAFADSCFAIFTKFVCLEEEEVQ